MINIVILFTPVIVENICVGLIQNMVVFIKNQMNNDFSHHAILNIAPCAERATVTSCPLENRV